MSVPADFPAPLTFADADKSPLSIRAKALVFVDARSRQLRERAEALAGNGQPLLILGETGTGKELLARYIHRHSERGGLFVAVSCAAISPQWGEAELFGHVGGAAWTQLRHPRRRHRPAISPSRERGRPKLLRPSRGGFCECLAA